MRRLKQISVALILIVGMILTFQGCQKDIDENVKEDHINSNVKGYNGEKLENPYSVSNMKKALLKIENSINLEVTTTHYYVKFVVKSDSDLDSIKVDKSIELYPYPLDYNIKMDDNNNVTQNEEGTPVEYFCSVNKDYQFPNVEYEILENLFIPEELENYKTHEEFFDLLVDTSLSLTGNIEDKNTKASSWRPAGTMKVWDDNLAVYVPIKHLKVRARRWFTTYTGITNANGYYSCDGTFKRDANYSIQFERYDFEIRDHWLSTANINGPKKRGDWDLNMKDDIKEFWATIFRATSHYYYDDIHGLRRPPENSFWQTQLKIKAKYEDDPDINGSHSPARRFLGLGSAIFIYYNNHNSRDIYGTTIHELAHASHWKMDKDNYNCMNDSYCFWVCCDGDLVVSESWARGVQWNLTSMIYPSSIMSGYPSYSGFYTGVVQDMIDGTGGYDQVSGYTIRQIEDALNGVQTWEAWKNNIKNSYNNATENNLDQLFDYWN